MTPYLLQQLLTLQTARAPGRLAFQDDAAALTYAELDDASDRLAGVLARHGVGRGDRVGLYMDKSAAALTAMFGALKCGAAYVPIDPLAPAKRAAFVARDCGLKALVTTRERHARLLPELEPAPDCVLLADTGEAARGALGWSSLAAEPARAPAPSGLTGEDLAYILYTSGSTGTPKGVMLSHRAALSFVRWAVDFFAISEADRLASHAPWHFDLSVFDLFAAAATGACVCPVPRALGMFPRNLADWIEGTEISVWYSVPSVLIQLALRGGLGRHAFTRLRAVLFAGEVFPVAHLRALCEQLPRPAYYNLYGPTESNVCTVHRVSARDLESDAPVPIGRACANCDVFALTDDGKVAREGEAGELLVGGSSLMHGYWGRPEASAQALVADSRGVGRTEPIYRTGDRVRLDEAGEFHFLGRRDAQVKSRGYRIELGEVESVLGRHADVAEAVVFAVPHAQFGCELRGVVVARPGTRPSREEIIAFCAALLPPYMVPVEISCRTDLPRTSSGKVDRLAIAGGQTAAGRGVGVQ